jgi:hypothetical protein
MAWLTGTIEDNPEFPASCSENCFTDSDCADDEVCCANDCGGHVCYRSKNGTRQKTETIRSKCHEADSIMNCMYDNIKQIMCPLKRTQW